MNCPSTRGPLVVADGEDTVPKPGCVQRANVQAIAAVQRYLIAQWFRILVHMAGLRHGETLYRSRGKHVPLIRESLTGPL